MAFGSDLDTLPVSIPRTMIGHGYAAAGALDAVTALMALRHHLIPPTINCEHLDPRYGLDMVCDEARLLVQQKQAVLLGGRAIGGANIVVALKSAMHLE
jgi:3-oxoacyl-(acyl-carrier-protein) synthase